MGVRERVVRVWCGESKKVGSGYRVDAYHVLTAVHVLTADHIVDHAPHCHVRLDGETNYRPATVLWRGRGNIDIALLQLGDDSPPLDDDDPIWAGCRWVDGKCEAAGYPAFLTFDDEPEREEFVGKLRSEAGVERGRIHAVGDWAENRLPEQWGGMSGAALFSNGCLIGVVVEALAANRLLACPISKLFDDEEFSETFPYFSIDHTFLWPVADRPAVRLLRPMTVRKSIGERRPSELLLAHNEVVRFDDSLRAGEIDMLEKFSRPQRIRDPRMLVFTGPGGAGKTRLLLEWCARIRERGWLAGFVESDHATNIAHITQGETPRLLVVDYPEGRVSEVALLCRWAQAATVSIRLVLLARSRGPWFGDLSRQATGSLVARATWHELGKLDMAQRRRAYRRACAAFSGASEDQVEVTPQELAQDELPLYAHMRALLRGYGDSEVNEKPEQVLAQVLEHERNHWEKQLTPLLGGKPGKALIWDLDRVMAALVVFGGIDAPLGNLIRWLRPELNQREREAFGDCIAKLYRHEDRIIALQPDLLGEQLVFEAISHAAEHDGPSGVEWWLNLPSDERAPQDSVERMLVVLTRLADRGVGPAQSWLRAFVERVREPDGTADVSLVQMLTPTLRKTAIESPDLRVEVGRVLLKNTLATESPNGPRDSPE